MPDGREKLLMPCAKKDRATLFQKVLPFFFIDDAQPKSHAVNPDKVVNKNNKGAGVYNKLKSFEHGSSFKNELNPGKLNSFIQERNLFFYGKGFVIV